MKTRYLFAILGCGSVGANAVAQMPADFKPAVRTMVAGLAKALINEDINFFVKNSTADFVFVDHRGKAMGKKEAMKSIEVSFEMFSDANVKHTINGTLFKDGLGSAKVTQTFFGFMAPNGAGKRNTMKVVTVTQIYWKKVNGKWLFSKVKELKPAQYWMNDKPFNPFAPPK